MLYVFITYLFYTLMTGQPFEFGAADSLFYNNNESCGSHIPADFHYFSYENQAFYNLNE